ncbi:hypothetical protein MRX96_003436 [Rhipicephalus microplus]
MPPLPRILRQPGHDTGWRKMFTPLLTFQIVACWVADTVGLGDCAWSPPGDLPVPIAPSSHLDQPRISSPIVSPLIPARACSYAWQRFSSSTSPTTWGQCGLHNLHNITKSSGHDTGWRKMFTPLLTFQIVACWVADTVGLGDCAWSPPGDLPVPIAPSSHLDQPRISSPIVSPLIPARACSYAWQRFSSSTSPTTHDRKKRNNTVVKTEESNSRLEAEKGVCMQAKVVETFLPSHVQKPVPCIEPDHCSVVEGNSK